MVGFFNEFLVEINKKVQNRLVHLFGKQISLEGALEYNSGSSAVDQMHQGAE